MPEFTVNDKKYSTGKLTPRQQFHVARRLAPVLKGLGGTIAAAGGIKGLIEAASAGSLAHDLSAVDPLSVIQPLVDAVSSMSDADVDYILDMCMNVATRQTEDGKAWGPVQVNGLPMYPDMNWTTMLQITCRVIADNLQNFT